MVAHEIHYFSSRRRCGQGHLRTSYVHVFRCSKEPQKDFCKSDSLRAAATRTGLAGHHGFSVDAARKKCGSDGIPERPPRRGRGRRPRLAPARGKLESSKAKRCLRVPAMPRLQPDVGAVAHRPGRVPRGRLSSRLGPPRRQDDELGVRTGAKIGPRESARENRPTRIGARE